jgi:hypothetical protein
MGLFSFLKFLKLIIKNGNNLKITIFLVLDKKI